MDSECCCRVNFSNLVRLRKAFILDLVLRSEGHQPETSSTGNIGADLTADMANVMKQEMLETEAGLWWSGVPYIEVRLQGCLLLRARSFETRAFVDDRIESRGRPRC